MMFCDFADPVLHFFWGGLELEGGSAKGATAFFFGGVALVAFPRKYDGTIFQIRLKVI